MEEEEELREESREEGMGGAQYRPIMEGLDRPAAGGRNWELLIGGEKGSRRGPGSMGAGDLPEEQKETKTKQQKNK